MTNIQYQTGDALVCLLEYCQYQGNINLIVSDLKIHPLHIKEMEILWSWLDAEPSTKKLKRNSKNTVRTN